MYIRHDEIHEESRFASASSQRSSHSLHLGHWTKCLLSFLAASSRRFNSLELSRGAFMPKELGSGGLVPGLQMDGFWKDGGTSPQQHANVGEDSGSPFSQTTSRFGLPTNDTSALGAGGSATLLRLKE